jgi:hypothetical protein
MGLEAATYINGLVATNPVGATDDRSTADDHLRLIKAVLLNTFPNLTGAVAPTQAQLLKVTYFPLCDGSISASDAAIESAAQFGIRNNAAASASATIDFITPPVGRVPGAATQYQIFPTLGGLLLSTGAYGLSPGAGWTSAKTGTGRYTINHNLGRTYGTDRMMVVVGAATFSNRLVTVFTAGATSSSFDVQTFDATTGANADSDFSFIVTIW